MERLSTRAQNATWNFVLKGASRGDSGNGSAVWCGWCKGSRAISLRGSAASPGRVLGGREPRAPRGSRWIEATESIFRTTFGGRISGTDLAFRESVAHSAKSTFHVGDHVSWNSEAGHVSGVIKKKLTAATKLKGYVVRASEEEPQYVIESDKTDHVAVHKGSALRKLRGARAARGTQR